MLESQPWPQPPRKVTFSLGNPPIQNGTKSRSCLNQGWVGCTCCDTPSAVLYLAPSSCAAVSAPAHRVLPKTALLPKSLQWPRRKPGGGLLTVTAHGWHQAACCQSRTKRRMLPHLLLPELPSLLPQAPSKETAICSHNKPHHCVQHSRASAPPVSQTVKRKPPWSSRTEPDAAHSESGLRQV